MARQKARREIDVDLAGLLVGAASLASEVEREFWDVLVDVLNFKQEVDEALAAGEPVAQGKNLYDF